MSFEIQELPDVIRVIVLLNLTKGISMSKTTLKKRVDKISTKYAHLQMSELEEALQEMASEGLIKENNGSVQLTEQGLKLGKEWESLLLKKEPILEVVAGLVDGSITALVVILSAFMAVFTSALSPAQTVFAAFLTLSAVAITNFSSFLLGGITEDLADIRTLQVLMNFSLSDIPDKEERAKSLLVVKKLFTLLAKEIHRSNVFAAIICGTTTFAAGCIPIVTYILLSSPLDIILSLIIIGVTVGIFLVRYRSRKTRVNWKTTLVQTLGVVLIATVISLLLGIMA